MPPALNIVFSQIHGVTNVRQIEMHTTMPLGHKPSSFQVETATEVGKGTNCQALIKFQEY
jgi:hypothetical protein